MRRMHQDLGLDTLFTPHAISLLRIRFKVNNKQEAYNSTIFYV